MKNKIIITFILLIFIFSIFVPPMKSHANQYNITSWNGYIGDTEVTYNSIVNDNEKLVYELEYDNKQFITEINFQSETFVITNENGTKEYYNLDDFIIEQNPEDFKVDGSIEVDYGVIDHEDYNNNPITEPTNPLPPPIQSPVEPTKPGPPPIQLPVDPTMPMEFSIMTEPQYDYDLTDPMAAPRYYFDQKKYFQAYRYMSTVNWSLATSYRRGNASASNVYIYTASPSANIKAPRQLTISKGTVLSVVIGAIITLTGWALTLWALTGFLTGLGISFAAGAIVDNAYPYIKVKRYWTLNKVNVYGSMTLGVELYDDYVEGSHKGKTTRTHVQSGGKNWYSNRWMSQKADVAYQQYRWVNHQRLYRPSCSEFSWCN